MGIWWRRFVKTRPKIREFISRGITCTGHRSANAWNTHFKPPKLLTPRANEQRHESIVVVCGGFVARGQSQAAALSSFAVAALILFGLENQRNNWMRLAIQIQRHIRNVGGTCMFALTSEYILSKYFYADFHRSIEN